MDCITSSHYNSTQLRVVCSSRSLVMRKISEVMMPLFKWLLWRYGSYNEFHSLSLFSFFLPADDFDAILFLMKFVFSVSRSPVIIMNYVLFIFARNFLGCHFIFLLNTLLHCEFSVVYCSVVFNDSLVLCTSFRDAVLHEIKCWHSIAGWIFQFST